MTERNRFRYRRPVLSMVLLAAILAVGTRASSQTSPEDVIVVDGNMWALAASSPLPWADAVAFCETLDAGDFNDWRLPTLAELQSLHDSEAEASLRGPFELEDCCAWSSMNLVDLEPEPKGDLPGPGGPPGGYYWGYLFDGGISYYANGRFPDGSALCVRDTAND